MKKLLLSLFVLTISVYASISVYDYRATFKRIEPVAVNNDGNCFTYLKTVTDIVRGYLIINDCDEECGSEKVGVIYLYRPSDKQYANTVWKTNVKVTTSFYGRNFRSCTPKSEIQNNLNKLNQCNINVVYDLKQPISYDEIMNVKGKDCGFIYGFLGWMNEQGTVTNHGFGSAMVKNKEPEYGFCSTIQDGQNCVIIKSASGSMTGNFGYSGVCGTTGAINDCGDYIVDMTVSGNWTIKLNSKKTHDAPFAISDVDNYIMSIIRKDYVFDASEQAW